MTQKRKRNESPIDPIILAAGKSNGIPIGNHFVLGRQTLADHEIRDPFVSTRHFRIEKKGRQYILRDLQSSNGTYLNGSQIFEASLANGDRLQAGETELVFLEKTQCKNQLSSLNSAWREKLSTLASAAKTEHTVLLLGESGSGKEVLAKNIHQLSHRQRAPFVVVNCGGLSESLVESELFGHIKGSFTGASYDRKGAFEAARGGTLFLDEIGDLPMPIQPRLLRALDNREIRPVGSDRTIRTDVRIIAATHRDLKTAVAESQFRADLFFRLNIISYAIPPLRKRLEDFDSLLFSFAREFRVRFSVLAIEKLKRHTWSGNIRELKNLVARASALNPSENIDEVKITQLLNENTRVTANPAQAALPVIQEIERRLIARRLEANDGNQRRTARDLGMPKSTLHDRIHAYGINVATPKA